MGGSKENMGLKAMNVGKGKKTNASSRGKPKRGGEGG